MAWYAASRFSYSAGCATWNNWASFIVIWSRRTFWWSKRISRGSQLPILAVAASKTRLCTPIYRVDFIARLISCSVSSPTHNKSTCGPSVVSSLNFSQDSPYFQARTKENKSSWSLTWSACPMQVCFLAPPANTSSNSSARRTMRCLPLSKWSVTTRKTSDCATSWRNCEKFPTLNSWIWSVAAWSGTPSADWPQMKVWITNGSLKDSPRAFWTSKGTIRPSSNRNKVINKFSRVVHERVTGEEERGIVSVRQVRATRNSIIIIRIIVEECRLVASWHPKRNKAAIRASNTRRTSSRFSRIRSLTRWRRLRISRLWKHHISIMGLPTLRQHGVWISQERLDDNEWSICKWIKNFNLSLKNTCALNLNQLKWMICSN